MTELEFIIEGPGEGRAVAFPSTSFVVGSDESCQLRFAEGLLQPRHAEVVRDLRGQWWIRDLMGTGMVVVNGSPVLDERLAPGDALRIGAVLLSVKDSGVDKRARTVSGEQLVQAASVSEELARGSIIDGRYRVLGKLAAGGMGEVYRAEHVELGKALALKVMLPELSRNDDFVGRFKREAIAASRIGQHNIVDISDFGRTDDGRFYFVMEYLDGATLTRTLRADGPFPFQRVVHVGVQVARALAAAHAQRIVHRDLKPDNVMLLQRPGQPDFVKVLDFGIAKVPPAAGAAGFTALGTVVGTPQYMSPEQAAGVAVDLRSDVYTLGLILHELLNGTPTFNGDSVPDLMAAQINQEPPPLRSPHGPVPRELEALVWRLLKKDPKERPESMEWVAEALLSIAAFPTPSAATAPMPAAAPRASPRAASAFERAASAGAKTDALIAAPAARTEVVTLAPEEDRSAAATQQVQAVATPRPPASVKADAVAALRPRRWPWVVGATAVVVVGLVVSLSGGEASAPQVEPPQPLSPALSPRGEGEVPKPPPAASLVKLTFTSDERAEVYEEDVLLGTTPLTLSRPPGALTTLRFEAKGFEPLTRKLRFESDTTVPVSLSRVKKGGAARPPREELKDAPY